MGGMTAGTETEGPGWDWGCQYNRGTLEVRESPKITALVRRFSVCHQFSAVLNNCCFMSYRKEKMPLSVASFIKPVCTCYLYLRCWCFTTSFGHCGLLTLSVYLLMEPELWQSWTEERAGPAGSLCWYHDCPFVSGTAGAGLGLLGHAVKCSVKRREEESEHSRTGLGLYKEHFQVQNNTSISTVWPWTSHI